MNDADTPRPLQAYDLERLLTEHLPALRAYVHARLGPKLAAHESASDVVQSVCRELLQEQGKLEYRGDEAFRGWLFTAALHKIWQHDRYWQAEKRTEVGAHASSEEQAEDMLAGYAHLFTPSRECSAREQLEKLEHALATLPDVDRELIAMAKIARLPHAEIARSTGRSEDACRQALRRALVKLAAALDG